MTVFHLVRHAETVWHAENRYAGWSDVGLTPRGYQQASELAAWAGGTALAAVVSSDLSRAVLTAEPAARAAGTVLRVQPLLREVDFGDADGLTKADMRERFPEQLRAFHDRPATAPLPNAESGEHACSRAVRALCELAEELPDAQVLVVTHSTLLRLIVAHAVGIPLDNYRRVMPEVRNVARTTLSGSALALTTRSTALLAFNSPVPQAGPAAGTRAAAAGVGWQGSADGAARQP